jgi:hypothetical protein
MSDLEKFLQQAAQRMKERQQAAGQQPRPMSPPQAQQSTPAKPSARPPMRKEERQTAAYQDEVVEAEVVDLTPRDQGPNRLSNLDTRAKPGTANVSMADERMTNRLQQVFDHNVGHLPKTAGQVQVSTVVANEQTNRKIEVETQRQDIHWVTKLLQDPESLRSAFIASEIFKRKF